MFKRLYILIIISIVMLFLPIGVFAEETNILSDIDCDTNILENDILDSQNDSIDDTSLNSDRIISDGEISISNTDLELVKNIIGNDINVDLLESQAYSHDDKNNSLLNIEIENKVKSMLEEKNFDYSSLGYSFSADFLNDNDFAYKNIIRIFCNSVYLDQIMVNVIYKNTNDHTHEEQNYVDNIINNNSFIYENEFYLEDYYNQEFCLEDEVDSVVSQYDIDSVSLNSSYIGGNSEYPFVCFYNNKYYGKLVAILNETIKVKVPSNVINKNNYMLNKVKEFFVNKYSEFGISNFIDNDTEFYYNEGFIFAKNSFSGLDFKIGKFIIDVENVVVNPEPSVIENDIIFRYTEDRNYNNNYSRNNNSYYSKEYTYYENEPVGSTLGVEETVVDISDILKSKKSENISVKKSIVLKNDGRKEETKKEKKIVEKKETEKSEKGKLSAIKILFIILAGISLVGVIIAIINRILVNSELSVDV